MKFHPLIQDELTCFDTFRTDSKLIGCFSPVFTSGGQYFIHTLSFKQKLSSYEWIVDIYKQNDLELGDSEILNL